MSKIISAAGLCWFNNIRPRFVRDYLEHFDGLAIRSDGSAAEGSGFRVVLQCLLQRGRFCGLTRLYNGELRPMNFILDGYGFRVVRRVRG